jgi:hypothetical protein
MADRGPRDPSAPITLGRRRSPRVRVQRGPRVRCRLASPGGGPDLDPEVLDVSEGGIRLLINATLTAEQQVEVTLEGPGQGQAFRRPARVIWSVPTADGFCCVGAQFEEPLGCRDLQALAGN